MLETRNASIQIPRLANSQGHSAKIQVIVRVHLQATIILNHGQARILDLNIPIMTIVVAILLSLRRIVKSDSFRNVKSDDSNLDGRLRCMYNEVLELVIHISFEKN